MENKYKNTLHKKLPHIDIISFLEKSKGHFYCQTHDIYFTKNIYHCLNSKGCPKCRKESYNKNRSTKWKELLEAFDKKHNSFYTYSNDYTNTDTFHSYDRILINCPQHGWFKQQVSVHKNGSGCPQCKREKLKNHNSYDFDYWVSILNKKHNNKYKYYNTFKSKKMKMECPTHGIFWQNPSIHKLGHGCPSCAQDDCKIIKPLTTEEWIQRANKKWSHQWDYSEVKYQNTKEKIIIICDKHGKFLQTPNDHLNGCGCPKCFVNTSKAEEEINNFINKMNFETKINDRSIIHPKELDIVIPSLKLAIEFNGLYWHSFGKDDPEDPNIHLNKTLEAKKKNYNLIHICEYNWLNNKSLILSMIKNKLGKNEIKLGARECSLSHISNKIYKQFCQDNHIQGPKNSSIKIGLYYKENLVSIMSFSKHNKWQWEIDRFCNKQNYTIRGGASKLFKYFINNYKPDTILSYANLDYSDGNIYKNLNFTYMGMTKPNYFWIKGNQVYNRHQFQKHKLKNKLEIYNENLSESQNMFNNNFRRYWNSGNYKFVWFK